MLTIRVIREPSIGITDTLSSGVTLGTLYLDDVRSGDTLEPRLRETPGQPVEQWKVPNATAIPAGVYALTPYVSPRLHRQVLLLQNVPGFEDVEVHLGNTVVDTHGCILVGTTRVAQAILNSAAMLNTLITRATAAGGAVLRLENPPGWWAARGGV